MTSERPAADAPTQGVTGRTLAALEEEAALAVTSGDLGKIVSVRGRISRLRRTSRPQPESAERMLALDRTLASAIVGLQLSRRRARPIPMPERVTGTSTQRAGA